MRTRVLGATLACLTVFFVLVTARAQISPSFEPLGLGPGGVQSFAWDVSASGNVVIGTYWVPDAGVFHQRGFRWETGVFSDLGALDPKAPEVQALAVSDDGSKVVGWSRAISGFLRPFVWTAAGGMQELANVSGSDAVAADISRDGTVIVGYFLAQDGYHAFRWSAGVVTDLGFLPGGLDSKALAVCGPGVAVVGETLQSDFSSRAFRWRPNSVMENLGGLQGVQTSYAEGCSDDGNVVIGSSTNDKGNLLATRWDPTGIRSLGALGGSSSEAHAVSGDGGVVVGGAGLPFVNGISEFTAFIWTSATGKMSQLSRVLQNLGVTTPFCHAVPCPAGSWFLQLALGISADGSVIVGLAQDPNGNVQAFRAVVSTSTTSGGGGTSPCSSGFTQVTLTVNTAVGAAPGTVVSKQTSANGSKLSVSSGQTVSACFQANKTLGFQTLNNRLADWAGNPAITCKNGNLGQNLCQFQLGAASQSVTATLE